MAKIIITLGGNALGNTAEEQKEKVAHAAEILAGFIEHGHTIVISHGNGPQVGMINLGLNHSAAEKVIKASMPLPECVAMSQGYIGYHIQNALIRELTRRNLNSKVATIITEVEVDKNDPAFAEPTKPVGAFMTEAEAKEKMAENPHLTFKEDSGRGWRLVVPSPRPVDIIEKDIINNLVNSGCTVIACGGGGIPVVKSCVGDYKSVAAVIDKDFASELLAELIDADLFYILTAVDKVCLNFNKPDMQELDVITIDEAQQYINEKQFAEGSMLPKITAAMNFVKSGSGRKAVICSLDKAELAIQGLSGTVITR